MNIALGALIITILLLPGAVILKSYYRSFNTKEKDLYIPFGELLLRGLLLSFLAHFLAILALGLFHLHPDYTLLYHVAIGDKINLDNRDFTRSFVQFSEYNLVLVIALSIITKRIKAGIIHRNLDLRFNGLRTANYWYHIFSARYMRDRMNATDFIWVDILAKEKIIYSGFLHDFEYSPSKDQLETITLTNATKRAYPIEAKDDKHDTQQHPLQSHGPRSIQGDAFIIVAKDIANINLYYLSVRQKQQPPKYSGLQVK